MKPQLFQYLFLSTILGLSAASVVKFPGPHNQRAISDDLSSSTRTLPTESGYEPTSTSDISSQGKKNMTVNNDEQGKPQGATIVL